MNDGQKMNYLYDQLLKHMRIKWYFKIRLGTYYMVVQNPLVLRSDSLIMSQSMKCHQTVITAEYGQTGFMARGDRGFGARFYIELYTG